MCHGWSGRGPARVSLTTSALSPRPPPATAWPGRGRHADGRGLRRPQFAMCVCRYLLIMRCRGTAGRGLGRLSPRWAELLAVDQVGGSRVGVPGEAGDSLDADAGVGHEAHEGVTEFARVQAPGIPVPLTAPRNSLRTLAASSSPPSLVANTGPVSRPSRSRICRSAPARSPACAACGMSEGLGVSAIAHGSPDRHVAKGAGKVACGSPREGLTHGPSTPDRSALVMALRPHNLASARAPAHHRPAHGPTCTPRPRERSCPDDSAPVSADQLMAASRCDHQLGCLQLRIGRDGGPHYCRAAETAHSPPVNPPGGPGGSAFCLIDLSAVPEVEAVTSSITEKC